jgi:hypothetical protein
MSIRTAVVAAGGTQPVISATTNVSADIGIVALEYSGLSTVADTSVVDRESHAFGVTGAAATVTSGPTAAATGNSVPSCGAGPEVVVTPSDCPVSWRAE